MRPTHLLTALIALSLVAACGDQKPTDSGGAPTSGKSASELLDDATSAAAKEEWKAALVALDAALADSKATAEEKAQAWSDKITASARGNGDDAGKAAVQQMAASTAVLTAEQYASLGIGLAESDHPKVALDLLEVAKKKFGTDAVVMKKLKRVAKFCEQKFMEAGDSGALDQLKALGYLGAEGEDEEETGAQQ